MFTIDIDSKFGPFTSLLSTCNIFTILTIYCLIFIYFSLSHFGNKKFKIRIFGYNKCEKKSIN
jgi:hypothetical protein